MGYLDDFETRLQDVARSNLEWRIHHDDWRDVLDWSDADVEDFIYESIEEAVNDALMFDDDIIGLAQEIDLMGVSIREYMFADTLRDIMASVVGDSLREDANYYGTVIIVMAEVWQQWASNVEVSVNGELDPVRGLGVDMSLMDFEDTRTTIREYMDDDSIRILV